MHRPLPLYRPATLRALEARGTAAHGGDAFALMRMAGQAAWRIALKRWPQAQRILVACGDGNNGGDGYVLARHALESGRQVQALRVRPPTSALARHACVEYLAAGGAIVDFHDALPEADLVVDALFGIGLSRAPSDADAVLIQAINAHPAPVLALDVPSGIDADNGAAPGYAVSADCTVQFIARHRGLRTGLALDHAGELELATLDLPDACFAGIEADALAWRADALPGFFPLRARDSHKGRHGHVLCVGGDHGRGGAILLAAAAALRVGAGLVSVATRADHVAALLSRVPEAMAHSVDDVGALEPLLAQADVVAVGPGLGQDTWGRRLLAAVIASGTARVVDADGLNLMAATGQRLTKQDVITPHPGEAGRLLGVATADVQRDRFAAAHALSERFGVQVVLKGAGTVVASPDAVPVVVCAGNPGMAVGGMGDLLTGAVAALLAQGFAAHDAAVAGALLHASAGDAAARDEGERGLLPSDLLPWMRRLANPMRR